MVTPDQMQFTFSETCIKPCSEAKTCVQGRVRHVATLTPQKAKTHTFIIYMDAVRIVLRITVISGFR